MISSIKTTHLLNLDTNAKKFLNDFIQIILDSPSSEKNLNFHKYGRFKQSSNSKYKKIEDLLEDILEIASNIAKINGANKISLNHIISSTLNNHHISNMMNKYASIKHNPTSNRSTKLISKKKLPKKKLPTKKLPKKKLPTKKLPTKK